MQSILLGVCPPSGNLSEKSRGLGGGTKEIMKKKGKKEERVPLRREGGRV